MNITNHYNADQAHAKLSASGADRWMLCPASVQAEEGLPDDSNIHAEQGTVAHELGDLCLKNEQDAIEYVGRWITVNGVGIYGRENTDRCQLITPSENHRDEVWKVEIDEEMADNVQLYLDYVRSYLERDSILMPERRVSFAHVVKGGFGTSDAIMLHPQRKHMDIFDLKYGFIPVVAKGNRQGRCYGVGALAEFDILYEFETVTIHICQPRVEDRYTSWELTVADLNEFAEEMRERSEFALSGKGTRVAGEKQCMWCKARDNCATRMALVEDVIGAGFDDLTQEGLPDAETLTPKNRANILNHKTFIEAFLRDVWDAEERTILGGGTVEGYKVVRGRTTRKLNDTGKKYLEHHLGVDAFKPKDHLGITAAEAKLRKKAGINKAKLNEAHEKYGLWDKKEGRLTMAKLSDSRDAVIIETFDDLTDEQGLGDL